MLKTNSHLKCIAYTLLIYKLPYLKILNNLQN